MDGNVRKALCQQISEGNPRMATPLHILLHGSDSALSQLAIVKALVENEIVPAYAFSELRDHYVDFSNSLHIEGLDIGFLLYL